MHPHIGQHKDIDPSPAMANFVHNNFPLNSNNTDSSCTTIGKTSHHFLKNLFRGIAIIDFVLACLIATTELIFTALPESYVMVYNIYNMKKEVITGEFHHHSSLFVLVLIITVFWLILEGFLYEVLTKGALEMDTKKLNRWINIRVLFLVLNVVQTLYRIIELQFCLYDTFYTPVIMYRILEIIFVKGLTSEIDRNQIDVIV